MNWWFFSSMYVSILGFFFLELQNLYTGTFVETDIKVFKRFSRLLKNPNRSWEPKNSVWCGGWFDVQHCLVQRQQTSGWYPTKRRVWRRLSPFGLASFWTFRSRSLYVSDWGAKLAFGSTRTYLYKFRYDLFIWMSLAIIVI